MKEMFGSDMLSFIKYFCLMVDMFVELLVYVDMLVSWASTVAIV